LGGDALYTFGRLDEVVPRVARLLTAESVGKEEWFGKLTSTYQETGAVDGPWAFNIHNAFFIPSAGPMFLAGIQVSDLAEHGRRPANACFKWSDCTRTSRAGQLHKNCATVEFVIWNLMW
jgi:hypothetical protein